MFYLQIFLQRLLCGEQVLEWSNGSVRARSKRECLLGCGRSMPRGHLLFEHYKRTGGFLGVGQGYYSRLNEVRRKLAENLQDKSMAAEISRASWCGGPGSMAGAGPSSTSVDDAVTSLEWDAGPSGAPQIHHKLSPNSCSLESEFAARQYSGSASNNMVTSHSAGIRLWSTQARDNLHLKANTELEADMYVRAMKEHPHMAHLLRKDALQAAQIVEKEGAKHKQLKEQRKLQQFKERVAKRSGSNNCKDKRISHKVKRSASTEEPEASKMTRNGPRDRGEAKEKDFDFQNEQEDNIHRATNKKEEAEKPKLRQQQRSKTEKFNIKTGNEKEELEAIRPFGADAVDTFQKEISKREKSSSNRSKKLTAGRRDGSSALQHTQSDICARRSSQHPHYKQPFNSTSLQSLPCRRTSESRQTSPSKSSIRSEKVAGCSKSHTTGISGRQRRSKSETPIHKSKLPKRSTCKNECNKADRLEADSDPVGGSCGRTRSASILLHRISHGFVVKQKAATRTAVQESCSPHEEKVKASYLVPKHPEAVGVDQRTPNSPFEETENKDVVSSSISGYIRSLVFGDPQTPQEEKETIGELFVSSPRNHMVMPNSPMTTIDEVSFGRTPASSSDDTCKNVKDIGNLTFTQDVLLTSQPCSPIAEEEREPGNGDDDYLHTESPIAAEPILCVPNGVKKSTAKSKKKAFSKQNVLQKPDASPDRKTYKAGKESEPLLKNKVLGIRSNLYESAPSGKRKAETSRDGRAHSQLALFPNTGSNKAPQHPRSPEVTTVHAASKLSISSKHKLLRKKRLVKNIELNKVSSSGTIDNSRPNQREISRNADGLKLHVCRSASDTQKQKIFKSQTTKKMRSKQNVHPSKKGEIELVPSIKLKKFIGDKSNKNSDLEKEEKKSKKKELKIMQSSKISGPENSKLDENDSSAKILHCVPGQLKEVKSNRSSSDFKVELVSQRKPGKEGSLTSRSSSYHPVNINAEEAARSSRSFKERQKCRKAAAKMLDNYEIEVKKEEVLGSVVSLVTYRPKNTLGFKQKGFRDTSFVMGDQCHSCANEMMRPDQEHQVFKSDGCSTKSAISATSASLLEGSEHKTSSGNVYPRPSVELDADSERELTHTSPRLHGGDDSTLKYVGLDHDNNSQPIMFSLRPSALDEVVKNLGSPVQHPKPEKSPRPWRRVEDEKSPSSPVLEEGLGTPPDSRAISVVAKPIECMAGEPMATKRGTALSSQTLAVQQHSVTISLQNQEDEANLNTSHTNRQLRRALQESSPAFWGGSSDSHRRKRGEEYLHCNGELLQELGLQNKPYEIGNIIQEFSDTKMQVISPPIPIYDNLELDFADGQRGQATSPELDPLGKYNEGRGVRHCSQVDASDGGSLSLASCSKESERKHEPVMQSEPNVFKVKRDLNREKDTKNEVVRKNVGCNSSGEEKEVCVTCPMVAHGCDSPGDEKEVCVTCPMVAHGRDSPIKSLVRKLEKGNCEKDKSHGKYITIRTSSKIKPTENKKNLASFHIPKRSSFIKGQKYCPNKSASMNSTRKLVSKQDLDFHGQAKTNTKSKVVSECGRNSPVLHQRLSTNRTNPIKLHEVDRTNMQSLRKSLVRKLTESTTSSGHRRAVKGQVSSDLDPNDPQTKDHQERAIGIGIGSFDHLQSFSCRQKCKNPNEMLDTNEKESVISQKNSSLAERQSPDGGIASVDASDNGRDGCRRHPSPGRSFVTIQSKTCENAMHVFGSNVTFELSSFQAACPKSCGFVEPEVKVSNYRLNGDHFRKYRQRKESDED